MTSKKVDIRELMKRQKVQKSLSSTKKIDSPLARYNNLGQLSCKLCNLPIKSEILWKSHLQSRKHKESVELLKSGKSLPGPPTTVTKNTKQNQEEEEPVVKKVKVEESSTSSTKGLPADFFDIEISSSEVKQQQKSSSETTHSSNNKLPADFFESQKNKSNTSTEKDVQPDSSSKSMAEALPEGFFDDPDMDAKVRKVEPKKNIEDEWADFQKVMEQEQQVSEAILEEDVDEAQKERQIDEIDEQMTRWKKADILRDKQDELRAKATEMKSNKDNENTDEDEDDEADFEEFLDWRSKEAWK